MDKVYLLLSSKFLNRPYLFSRLEEVGVTREQVRFADDYLVYFQGPAELCFTLDKLVLSIHEDLDVAVSVLSAYGFDAFSQKLSRNALKYFPNQCVHPTNVIMKELSFGDFSSFAPVMRLFKGAPEELLATMKTYLRCGLDACYASRVLGVHRNTFNYRLNAFSERTGIDVRDYHNALLLQLYFDFSNGQ